MAQTTVYIMSAPSARHAGVLLAAALVALNDTNVRAMLAEDRVVHVLETEHGPLIRPCVPGAAWPLQFADPPESRGARSELRVVSNAHVAPVASNLALYMPHPIDYDSTCALLNHMSKCAARTDADGASGRRALLMPSYGAVGPTGRFTIASRLAPRPT